MSILRRLLRGPGGQRAGRAAGRVGREVSRGLVDRLLPARESLALPPSSEIRRVLLVRPNFRIGNALMTAPLVATLRERFPEARIDYLGGDTTNALLAHLPIDAMHAMSRLFLLRPWRFVALIYRMRRSRYDVAVEAGLGSFSGGLYAFLSGARYRVGCSGKGDRFLNVRLPLIEVSHAYDAIPAFARSLGASCSLRPVYQVGEDEDLGAIAVLTELGLVRDGQVAPFVALFVGGHLHKRWPREHWLELARALERAGVPFVVFLGPEEVVFEGELRQELSRSAPVLGPRPLRIFAAMVARARLFVTPDSGPMHLAVALGVPTIALLQSEASRFYQPRGPEDRALVQPTPRDALAVITSHPRVADLAMRSTAVAQA